jgi:hypothetical protein
VLYPASQDFVLLSAELRQLSYVGKNIISAISSEINDVLPREPLKAGERGHSEECRIMVNKEQHKVQRTPKADKLDKTHQKNKKRVSFYTRLFPACRE